MQKNVEQRVAELIEPAAIEAKQRFYSYHNVQAEMMFWEDPVEALTELIERQLSDKQNEIKIHNPHNDDSLSLVIPDIARIQVTSEVLSQFKFELINVHGEAVFTNPFTETTNFEKHFYLKHLWQRMEQSGQWSLYDTTCEATRWEDGKMRFKSVPAYKLVHTDGTAVVIQLPHDANSYVRTFYFLLPPELQFGLNGVKRFKETFNLLIEGTNHIAMTSPCLMSQDDVSAPIADRPEWRFTKYDDGSGADDVTRLLAYWLRCGACRPMYDDEPRDMLHFANPKHAMLYKDGLTKYHKFNPYKLINVNHSIYQPELAAKLKCD